MPLERPGEPDNQNQAAETECQDTMQPIFRLFEEIRSMIADQRPPRTWEPMPEPPPEEELA